MKNPLFSGEPELIYFHIRQKKNKKKILHYENSPIQV